MTIVYIVYRIIYRYYKTPTIVEKEIEALFSTKEEAYRYAFEEQCVALLTNKNSKYNRRGNEKYKGEEEINKIKLESINWERKYEEIYKLAVKYTNKIKDQFSYISDQHYKVVSQELDSDKDLTSVCEITIDIEGEKVVTRQNIMKNYPEFPRLHSSYISGRLGADHFYNSFLNLMEVPLSPNLSDKERARLVDKTVEDYYQQLCKEREESKQLQGNKNLFDMDDNFILHSVLLDLKLTTFKGVYGRGYYRYFFLEKHTNYLLQLISLFRQEYPSYSVSQLLRALNHFLGYTKFSDNIMFDYNIDYYLYHIPDNKLQERESLESKFNSWKQYRKEDFEKITTPNVWGNY